MAWQSYRPFQLHGVLLAAQPPSGRSALPKRLVLDGEDGLTIVELDKSLRQSIADAIAPGTRLEIGGVQEVNLTRCKSRLLAQHIRTSDRLNPAIPIDVTPASPIVAHPVTPIRVLVCGKSHCWKHGGKDIHRKLAKTIDKSQWLDDVKLCKTGCMGHCKAGPNVVIAPAKITLRSTTFRTVVATLQRYIASLLTDRSAAMDRSTSPGYRRLF
jgi:(2Fe-2S) ferredoxin